MMSEERAAADLPVVVIGAGMSGLACASDLVKAGKKVTVFEASDAVGGRVRTDRHPEGYLLDRGFQVILSAYPALPRQVDLTSLVPHAFDAGALIWDGKRLTPLADPLRHPAYLAGSLVNSTMTLSDRVRLAKLAIRTRLAPWICVADATLTKDGSGPASELLWSEGFSVQFVDRFARPFWGGIMLDRSLHGSAGQLLFTLKMFLEGPAVLPAGGIQALPEAIANRLPGDAIELNRRVDEIVVENERVVGVRVGGELVPAAAVVVAADPIAAKALTGIESIPQQGRGCTTVYLAGDRQPKTGKRLVLNGSDDEGVNHLAPLTEVAPGYAPRGKHLISAVLLDHPRRATLPDEALAQFARVGAARMLGHRIEDWTPIATVRTPFAQFAQPPGIFGKLPINRTQTVGLYLAGEYTVDSSVNGAILAGERAASALVHDLQFMQRQERQPAMSE
jgi:phytoene dehydrogenase-like protein